MTLCPLCKSPVDVPRLDELLASRGITGHAAAILRAVWSARGNRIKASRIFDVMYEDDPDGGPCGSSTMYRDLWVGLDHLTTLLTGTGVGISYSGQSAGGLFKLTLQGGNA